MRKMIVLFLTICFVSTIFPAGSLAGEKQIYYLIETEKLSSDQKFSLICLQGIVNRTKPQIYIVADRKYDIHWVDWYHFYNYEEQKVGFDKLLNIFSNEIQGLAVYDPAQPHSIAYAAMFASAKNLLPASLELALEIKNKFPVVVNLKNRFSSRLNVYQSAYKELWPILKHDVICSQSIPKNLDGFFPVIFDLAIARCSFIHGMTLSPEFPKEAMLYEKILSETEDESLGLGWHVSTDIEATYVDAMSRHGVLELCGGASNMSFHQHIKNRKPFKQQQANSQELKVEDKVYVTFCLSDGDAMHAMVRLQQGHWASPLRGSFPFGWEVAPRFAEDLGPALLEYYYETKSENDYLVAGPSGISYNYPSVYKNLNAYIFKTSEAMNKIDSKTIWAINRIVRRVDKDHVIHRTMTGEVPLPIINGSLVENEKNTYGADYVDKKIVNAFIKGIPEALGFFQGFEPIPGANEIFVENKPWIPTKIMATSVEQALSEVERFSKEMPERPLFISVHASVCSELNKNALPKLLRIVSELRQKNVEIVRPDEFLILRTKANENN
jgi:hypothetical protein